VDFISFGFLLFLLLVTLLEPFSKYNKYFFISISSILFYSVAGGMLVAILLLSSMIDHFVSRHLIGMHKKKVLWFGVFLNLSFLVAVKLYYYMDFGLIGASSLIPLGISFYSLQSVSYLIDVYKGKIKRIDSFIEYLAYLSFFPQLIAGPIERCNRLYPQLKNFSLVANERLLLAIKMFVFGVYLKFVVSNRLAAPVYEVANGSEFDLIFLLNGFLGFVYVYVDFFSYTLMARGVAKLFNIDLSINFDRPFSRRTLIGLWQSWHISLTKWVTDYFYIPIMLRLQGRKFERLFFSVIAMILVGLWHGFSWNFLIFGFINGFMMQALPIIDKLTLEYSSFTPRLNSRLGIFITMGISGNLFLFSSDARILDFYNLENYFWLSEEWYKPYTSLGFLLGLVGLIPLAFHEFKKVSFLYKNFSSTKELILILSYSILIILFHAEGPKHVYFAF